ncbi:hypothetical protein TNIN_106571 [Trichonephila inaurata madagascariensis]|uniref:Uncharacterized protein n=1 Tax=Trichonephila inaurata madagascariensis TaxID=2747483 RepID=A0A8X6XBC5_9ARAC|nr:hypothetical protein TNIN_106571 [Trichonephila inaurata madagascariensis]
MGWRPPETTSDHQYVHFAQGCQVSRNWYTRVVKKSVPSRSWINMGWRPPETTSDHQYVHFAQGFQVSRNWYTRDSFTTRQSVDAACLGVNVMCAFLCVFCMVKKSVPPSWINMGWRPPETTSDHQYVHFAQGCQVSRNWYTRWAFTTRQSVDAACLGVNVMCAFLCVFCSRHKIKGMSR